MKTTQWTPLPLALLLIFFGLLSNADQAAAQSCENLIVRNIQGTYEQSSLGFQPVVTQSNQAGHIRMYWRSSGPDPHTLSAEFGHPSAFGYQGQNPTKVRQHFRMEGQNGQQVGRAKVNFQAMAPGQTTIGFRITGSKNGRTFNSIPQRCRSGVLTIQVRNLQQNSGNTGQGNYGGGQANVPGNQVAFIGGRYTTEFGDMVLNQDGQRVWGTYTQGQGKVEGTFDGQVLRGVWRQAPSYATPNDAGDVEFSFQNGQFTGRWRYGHAGEWNGGWSGRWVGR